MVAPNRQTRGRRGAPAAFTLIELLVVIGIIVLMIGGVGLAMRGGGSNVALQSAQGTVNSLVAAARGQAAVAQGTGYVLVNSDPDSDGFLREIRVAVKSAAGTWSFTGTTVLLPAGVYVVPAGGGTTPGVTFAAAWPDKRHSDLAAGAAITDGVTNESGQFFPSKFLFHADGSFGASATTNKLVLAPGRRTSATTLAFDNADLVRGIALSAYGAPIFINNATGFDN